MKSVGDRDALSSWAGIAEVESIWMTAIRTCRVTTRKI